MDYLPRLARLPWWLQTTAIMFSVAMLLHPGEKDGKHPKYGILRDDH